MEPCLDAFRTSARRASNYVRDLDAAIAAFKRAGGEVVSTAGRPVALPAGNATARVAIVRDPSHLFVVLIEVPPAVR